MLVYDTFKGLGLLAQCSIYAANTTHCMIYIRYHQFCV